MVINNRLGFLFLLLFSWVSFSDEILLDIQARPIRKFAVVFSPIVVPDLISAKMAFEFKIHRKFNFIWPIEAKWMDYRWAIESVSSAIGKDKQEYRKLYDPNKSINLGWNIDFYQMKVSSGIGLKWIPFSEAMTSGFFLKTAFLLGIERFNAFAAEGIKDGAVFTHNLSLGYSFISMGGFLWGLELGGSYVWHTNPIRDLPPMIRGFVPFLHINMGFAI